MKGVIDKRCDDKDEFGKRICYGWISIILSMSFEQIISTMPTPGFLER